MLTMDGCGEEAGEEEWARGGGLVWSLVLVIGAKDFVATPLSVAKVNKPNKP